MFKGAQNQCGSAAVLGGGLDIQQRGPAGRERTCQAQLRRSKVVAPEPITAPPLEAAVTARSYRSYRSSQPLQFTVHCRKLNHQRMVIQQTGGCRGRGPSRPLCLSPLPLRKQRLIPLPPREGLAQFVCRSPKPLAGGGAGKVCGHGSSCRVLDLCLQRRRQFPP